MPALNISNIKDAKLGSTQLTAVYKGSTKIWGNDQPSSISELLEYVVNMRVYTAINETSPLYEICCWYPSDVTLGSFAGKSYDPIEDKWWDLRMRASVANPTLRHTHNGIEYKPMQTTVNQANFTGRLIYSWTHTRPDGKQWVMNWETEPDGVWVPTNKEIHPIKEVDGFPPLFWSDEFPDLGIQLKESELEDG